MKQQFLIKLYGIESKFRFLFFITTLVSGFLLFSFNSVVFMWLFLASLVPTLFSGARLAGYFEDIINALDEDEDEGPKQEEPDID